MDMKKLYLANFNVTFGDKDDPLLAWLDEFVLPAMQKEYVRELSDKVSKVMFKDVAVEEIGDELAITGIIIKDTELEIYSQLDKDHEIIKTNQILKSAPYSIFVIYLKNHRMFLVKNQKGSPDLRLFTSTFEYVIKEYKKDENKIRKSEKRELLPYMIPSIKGLKQVTSIEEALKSVKKIKSLTIRMKPLNNEFSDNYDDLLNKLEQVRKKASSKNMKVVIPSPQSKKGVESIIENTNGLAETELEVEYYTDEAEDKRKASGRIKDNQMSQAMDIEITGDLLDAKKEISAYCKRIDGMNAENANIKDYYEYVQRRKMRDGNEE